MKPVTKRLKKSIEQLHAAKREAIGTCADPLPSSACGCMNGLAMWRGPKGEKGDQGPKGDKGDNAGSFLTGAEFVVNPEGQEPGSYLKLELIDVAQQEIVVYVDLSELEDVYAAGQGIDITNNIVSAELNPSNHVLTLGANGLGAEVYLSTGSSGTNLVLTGADGTVLSTVPLISAGTGNRVEARADGLYVPPAVVGGRIDLQCGATPSEIDAVLHMARSDSSDVAIDLSSFAECVANSVELSLDARCDDVVTPGTAEPFDDYLLRGSVNTLLLESDGTISDLKQANTIPYSSAIRGSFTMELFNPSNTDGLSIELYAYQRSGSDGRNYYSNVNDDEDYPTCQTLADFLAAGEQGIPLSYVEESEFSGVAPLAENETLYASVVSNGNNSYTFTFTVRTPDVTEQELTLDLVSGGSRTDLKPLLEHIGGKVEERSYGEEKDVPVFAGNVQIETVISPGYIIPPGISALDSNGNYLNISSFDISSSEHSDLSFDGEVAELQVEINYAESFGSGTMSTEMYSNAVEFSSTSGLVYGVTSLAEILAAGGVTLYQWLISSDIPIPEKGTRTMRLHVAEIAGSGATNLRFSLTAAETRLTLCLEPSCDPCIDLSPALANTIYSVTPAFDCVRRYSDHVTTVTIYYYDSNGVPTGSDGTTSKYFGTQYDFGRSGAVAYEVAFALSTRDGDFICHYGSQRFNLSDLSAGSLIPIDRTDNYESSARFPAQVFLEVVSVSGYIVTYKLCDPNVIDPQFTLTTVTNGGDEVEHVVDMSCLYTTIEHNVACDIEPVAQSFDVGMNFFDGDGSTLASPIKFSFLLDTPASSQEKTVALRFGGDGQGGVSICYPYNVAVPASMAERMFDYFRDETVWLNGGYNTHYAVPLSNGCVVDAWTTEDPDHAGSSSYGIVHVKLYGPQAESPRMVTLMNDGTNTVVTKTLEQGGSATETMQFTEYAVFPYPTMGTRLYRGEAQASPVILTPTPYSSDYLGVTVALPSGSTEVAFAAPADPAAWWPQELAGAAISTQLSNGASATADLGCLVGYISEALARHDDDIVDLQDAVAGITDYRGATATVDGFHGLVPAASTEEREFFLRGDGEWAEVPPSAASVQGSFSCGTNAPALTLTTTKTDGDVVTQNIDMSCLSAMMDAKIQAAMAEIQSITTAYIDSLFAAQQGS